MTEDLDRWLAEKCMVWNLDPATNLYCDGLKPVIAMQIWRPTDPATGQIWLCVERMRERGWEMLYENSILDNLNRVTLYIPAAGILDESWSAKGEAQDPNPALAFGKAIYEALKEEE